MFSKTVTTLAAGLALSLTASAAGAQMANHSEMTSKDIVEVAVEAGSFNTLLTAAKAAGLVGALKADGPLTVFAPTDEAFAKLPEGTVEMLLKPENKDKLTAVLLYHIVEGKVTSDQVVKLTSARTLEGDTIDISVKNGAVYVDDAQVVAADIDASNGVIHVIDSVLLPSMD
ncbi:MAG: fasciclin domain-containing protein [Candidatus Palauibacterales bacterium]|nr:fasciclin domain-containing protein [Candidatus Palauibacterales bacterium]